MGVDLVERSPSGRFSFFLFFILGAGSTSGSHHLHYVADREHAPQTHLLFNTCVLQLVMPHTPLMFLSHDCCLAPQDV